MVNFRFHLVSLTAVFLALGIGITVGATVVDQATVDALRSRLDGVERRVNATDRENARLREEVSVWSRFADQAAGEAVAGRLVGVPVLLVAVQGIDREPVAELRQALAAAGASVAGTVWFTSKARLDKNEDVAALGRVTGVESRRADVVREAMLRTLAADVVEEGPAEVLASLRDAAFVQFEGPEGNRGDLAGLATPNLRFVVISAPGADVPDADLALPFTRELARLAPGRVLAGEPSASDASPARREVRFVAALRADEAASKVVSTIDNVDDFRGRFAAVYALADLASGKIGHFGTGRGATRLVPETVR